MLTLVTGQPGNGKTLHALQLVEELRKKEPHRPVYQFGINLLPGGPQWLPLSDAREWAKCPEGSLIVIDEAWEHFPVRKQGSDVPDFVKALATHRHHGLDIFLITQHRQQLDTFVRKLVGRHIHLIRKHGADKSRVYQWEKETDATSTKEQEAAIKTEWELPREVFGWYKSAELHTVKKDFPWRKFWWVWAVAAVSLFAVVGSIYKVRHMSDVRRSAAVAAASPAGGQGVSSFNPPKGELLEVWRPEAATPRVRWLPDSAPRYDGVYKVETAPYIAGCMELLIGLAVECRCSDQSGAELTTDLATCLRVVKTGVFDPGRKYGDAKEENIRYLNATRGGQAESDGSAPQPAGGAAAGGAASPHS